MNLLNNYTGRDSFWEVNPQLLIVEEFEIIYSKDKSKNKEQSSKVMYALCFLVDPTEDNKFSNLKEEDRKVLIAKDFLKDKSFKWADYKLQIDKIKDLLLSPLERNLLDFKSELDKRNKFLSDYPWDMEDGDKKDKMLANTPKLHTMYKNLLEALNKEKIETRDKGGQMPSSSDTGSM